MNSKIEIKKIRKFIDRYENIGLLSTGAQIEYFDGDLYNITGSTKDPTEVPDNESKNWKQLLVSMADLDNADCYVTNPLPKGSSSHPKFLVGGHMTPNSNGIVERGGVCYLMPLCKWHNSTNRNRIAFQHNETKMLKLTGYMEGDTFTTFSLRMDSAEPYSVLHFDELTSSLSFLNVNEETALTMLRRPLVVSEIDAPGKKYALFQRREGMYYVVGKNF